MMEKRKQIVIKEHCGDIIDGRNLLIDIIDKQININKIRFLSDWESNHNMCTTDSNSKIKELELAKQEIMEFFQDQQTKNVHLNFTINFDIQILENGPNSISRQEETVD